MVTNLVIMTKKETTANVVFTFRPSVENKQLRAEVILVVEKKCKPKKQKQKQM